MGVVLALASACGDSGGGETTTQTDPGTSAATTTDEGTTVQTPTEGPATETAEGTASEPTTGGGGDPEILQKCSDDHANQVKLLEAQCQCLVELGGYPDLAACLAVLKVPDPVLGACTCEVYSRYPETEAGYDCIGPVLATTLACLEKANCADDTGLLIECLETYDDKVETCQSPGKPALAEVEIMCNMVPPFACSSGETLPETWKCNFEIDCMDASDENACPDTFMCADGTAYVPNKYKCDGELDCSDGSDEAGCPTFMCMDGMTIPEQFKCNGFAECDDGSDEGDAAMCPVFMCMNGMEIPEAFKCDGGPDCADGSDEADCPEFMCDNGMTLPGFVECDGFADCADASDEKNCP